MENRQSEVKLSPKQMQYNTLVASIRELRNKVMRHEGEIADLFNQPKDNTTISQRSTVMQNTINSVSKIEKEIEGLEKKKVKLAKNLGPAQIEAPEESQKISPRNR